MSKSGDRRLREAAVEAVLNEAEKRVAEFGLTGIYEPIYAQFGVEEQSVIKRDFDYDFPTTKMRYETCRYCGNKNTEKKQGWHKYVCPKCRESYDADVRSGRYPPGLNVSARQYFFIEAWQDLRFIERDVQNGVLSVEMAQEKMREVVQKVNEIPDIVAGLERRNGMREESASQERQARKSLLERVRDFKLY